MKNPILALMLCTVLPVPAADPATAAALDTKAAAGSFARQPTVSMDRSFLKPTAGRVYDADRQFVVETKEDGTITEMPYVVIPILFVKDSDQLLDDQSRSNVGKLAALLKSSAFATAKFEVEGHTCSDGSDEHNDKLSELRAAKLLGALKAAGVEESRLSAKGFGERAPAVPNDSETNKQENRRVVVVRRS
jgi:outer membrane protein OmpA-like peptidoglycan-associated protein